MQQSRIACKALLILADRFADEAQRSAASEKDSREPQS